MWKISHCLLIVPRVNVQLQIILLEEESDRKNFEFNSFVSYISVLTMTYVQDLMNLKFEFKFKFKFKCFVFLHLHTKHLNLNLNSNFKFIKSCT